MKNKTEKTNEQVWVRTRSNQDSDNAQRKNFEKIVEIQCKAARIIIACALLLSLMIVVLVAFASQAFPSFATGSVAAKVLPIDPAQGEVVYSQTVAMDEEARMIFGSPEKAEQLVGAHVKEIRRISSGEYIVVYERVLN